MFSAFRSTSRRCSGGSGATGAFPRAQPGRDFFAVTGQNSANNKTDIWMHRTISYDATYDPGTGRVDARWPRQAARTTPRPGPARRGHRQQRPAPPARHQPTFLSFYSPLQLTGSTVDGHHEPFETGLGFGYHVYSQYLTVGPGQTMVVTLDLAGIVAGGTDYRLSIAVQPMVNPDQFDAQIVPQGGWEVGSAHQFFAELDGSRAALVEQPGHQIDADAQLQRK